MIDYIPPKGLSLSERGMWDEQNGSGKIPTWKDMGGLPNWLDYGKRKPVKKEESKLYY